VQSNCAPAACASANEVGQAAGELLGQLWEDVGWINHPESPLQIATVLQAYEGSSPYSQPPTGVVPVQGVPPTGSVAGQTVCVDGQEAWLSL
jgi:hypothetical protein